MNVFEAIQTRRSIRKYKNIPVEKTKLLKVLEATRLAPSAHNYQPWRFIVITDPSVKAGLKSEHDETLFSSAPIMIVACALPIEAWKRKDGEEFWKVDVTIAMQNLVLAAWEEQLGTCWIGGFNEEKTKELLGIPENVRIVAMTPLGYPLEQKGKITNRKSIEEIVFYERWSPP